MHGTRYSSYSSLLVLSNSVGKAFQLIKSPGTDKTAEFVLFDCLNVTSLDEGLKKREPFKASYHSAKDCRMKVSQQSYSLVKETSHCLVHVD